MALAICELCAQIGVMPLDGAGFLSSMAVCQSVFISFRTEKRGVDFLAKDNHVLIFLIMRLERWDCSHLGDHRLP